MNFMYNRTYTLFNGEDISFYTRTILHEICYMHNYSTVLINNDKSVLLLKSQTTSERRVETNAEAEANAEQETPRGEAE